jgi:hypothetical protein
MHNHKRYSEMSSIINIFFINFSSSWNTILKLCVFSDYIFLKIASSKLNINKVYFFDELQDYVGSNSLFMKISGCITRTRMVYLLYEISSGRRICLDCLQVCDTVCCICTSTAETSLYLLQISRIQISQNLCILELSRYIWFILD